MTLPAGLLRSFRGHARLRCHSPSPQGFCVHSKGTHGCAVTAHPQPNRRSGQDIKAKSNRKTEFDNVEKSSLEAGALQWTVAQHKGITR